MLFQVFRFKNLSHFV